MFAIKFLLQPTLLLFLIGISWNIKALATDWPTFLGPTHNGVSTETGLLKEWLESGPPILWEMQTGSGYSSPSIVGTKLVYFHRIGNEEVVECLDAIAGTRHWKFAYPTDYEDRYGYSNGPRATPVIDDQRVYTFGTQGKLHCLNLETGAVIWKRDLALDYRLILGFFGLGTTPLIDGELLIVNVGAQDGPNVVAFNKQTGEVVWQAGDQWGASYASPIPATVHGQKRIFVFAGGERRPPVGGLLCINPTHGNIDFRFLWRSKTYESVNAACPTVVGNQVFISASYRTGSALLNIHSDFTYSVAWQTKDIGLHFNTAIHKEGYLYGFDGRNRGDASLVCIELKTGNVVWRNVLEWPEQYKIQGQVRNITLSPYRGSLILADDHFLCLGESGHLLWLDLSPQGAKIISRTWLFVASETWTPPVLSNGLLYITQNRQDTVNKTQPRLLCYDLRKK